MILSRILPRILRIYQKNFVGRQPSWINVFDKRTGNHTFSDTFLRVYGAREGSRNYNFRHFLTILLAKFIISIKLRQFLDKMFLHKSPSNATYNLSDSPFIQPWPRPIEIWIFWKSSQSYFLLKTKFIIEKITRKNIVLYFTSKT